MRVKLVKILFVCYGDNGLEVTRDFYDTQQGGL